MFMHHSHTLMGQPFVQAGETFYRKGNLELFLDDFLASVRTAIDADHDLPFDKLRKRIDDHVAQLEGQLSEQMVKRAQAETLLKTSGWMLIDDQIDTTVKEFEKILRKGAMPDSELQTIHGWCNSVADSVDNLMADPVVANQVKTNARKAYDVAYEAVKNDFTNYDDSMVLDVVMRFFNPFWQYQSRSWPWMVGQALRHPGALTNMGPKGRFWQHTDEGYLPAPILGVQLSPIRGTVLGRLRRAFRGPYPPRYSGLLGSVERFTQAVERYGFYPGLHLTVPIEMVSGLVSEGTSEDMASVLVEALPAMPATLVEGAIAASRAAGPEWTIRLAETAFPSKFRQYYMAKALWDAHKVTPTQAEKQGHQDWVADAYTRVATFSLVEQQMSLMRFNPESWQKIQTGRMAMVTEITGLTEDEQLELKRAGKRLSEVVPLSRIDRAKMQTVEGFDALAEATRPLSEGLRKEYLETMSDKYDMIEELRQSNLKEQAFDDQRMERGWISPSVWRENYYERWREYRESIDSLTVSNYYGKVGRTIDEQHAIREQLGFSPEVLHPTDVILDAMFSMEPSTDAWGNKDWTGLFEAQEDLLAIIEKEDPGVTAEVREYLNRNTTPMMKKFRDGREFMRPYWDINETLPEWHRSLGREDVAREIEGLFRDVRQAEAEVWRAVNMGIPVNMAKQLRHKAPARRLEQFVQEYRWHLSNDPMHPQYDGRIKGYLQQFYGRD